MTTISTQTTEEPKVCAQTFASLASLGILVHFGHEIVAMGGDFRAAEVAVGAVLVAATLGVTAAWYRLRRTPRRVLAVLIGALWSTAASEHLLNLGAGGEALDVTGLLTFGGGLMLAFAAFWDHHRPLERSL